MISKLEGDMDVFEDWYKARTSKIKEYMKSNTLGISMMMSLQKELSNVTRFILII
jgi:hypothetical protein